MYPGKTEHNVISSPTSRLGLLHSSQSLHGVQKT